MASLNEKRTFFHLSAIDENLYAVGGRNSQGELATVEKYFAKEDQVWVIPCDPALYRPNNGNFSGNLCVKWENLIMGTLELYSMGKCTFLEE